jgi:hypothetical protein
MRGGPSEFEKRVELKRQIGRVVQFHQGFLAGIAG